MIFCSCLAHIVNLATQAVLRTHSKSKHYDPKEPEKHEPDVEEDYRDEIGLIRLIVVKVTFFNVPVCFYTHS